MQGTTLRVLLCTGLVVQITRADVANNELLGWPVIQCNAETIEMRFATKKEFQGKVYVKGSYSKPECRAEYSTKTAGHSSTQGIKVEHGACNMSRQRLVPPEGMVLSTVFVISFHPLFITKADKIFEIRCMYKESSHSVTANLDVSMFPSEQLPMVSVSPTCSYTIRRDSLDGEILAYAKVGDQVVHRWHCDTEEFGILVHSCVVEDGQGQKELIVDEQGCHTDRLLLGDPTYVAALNMAYREAYIFKFADRISVRFRCEIRLCFKFDGGCEGVTV
ncbi:ZP domain-containing protein [Trichostrongylus colubriformis]|uniref:ZP domain-containing protein n=1 Tax=Trichostrongylus colubriformis TaxID=6319 RepID=A0AAN8FJF6_TRICO